MSKSQSICFECGNAGKCSFGARGVPVKGWKAERDVIRKAESEAPIISYFVEECPEYKPFGKIIELDDDGVKRLANEIVAQSIECYNKALKTERQNLKDAAQKTKRKLYGRKHRKLYGHKPVPVEIRQEEKFMRSGWCEMLTELDPERIITILRNKHGFKKGEKI